MIERLSETHFALLVVYMAISVVIYFIPNWVAMARHHHQGTAIFVTNLLLGWTGLGWIAALIWSFMAVQVNQTPTTAAPAVSLAEHKKCPDCAEMVKREARKCRFCGKSFDSA